MCSIICTTLRTLAHVTQWFQCCCIDLKKSVSLNLLISEKVISPLTNPSYSSPLSSSRADRWDPHLENQPRLWHSGASVARQRERGRQALASAGCPQQQQGGTFHPFNTIHHLSPLNEYASSRFTLNNTWGRKMGIVLVFHFTLSSLKTRLFCCIKILFWPVWDNTQLHSCAYKHVTFILAAPCRLQLATSWGKRRNVEVLKYFPLH